jgi:hypothetical protein
MSIEGKMSFLKEIRANMKPIKSKKERLIFAATMTLVSTTFACITYNMIDEPNSAYLIGIAVAYFIFWLVNIFFAIIAPYK